MTLSATEREEGQKAYQRIKAFARNKWSPVAFGFILFVVGNGIWEQYKRGGLTPAITGGLVWIALLGLGIWQYQREKRKNREDLIFLQTLKAKYGEDVYAEIQKEPHSLYYYLAQKRYFPDNRQVVKLP